MTASWTSRAASASRPPRATWPTSKPTPANALRRPDRLRRTPVTTATGRESPFNNPLLGAVSNERHPQNEGLLMVSVSPEPLQQGSSATICLLVRYLRFLAVESLRPEGGIRRRAYSASCWGWELRRGGGLRARPAQARGVCRPKKGTRRRGRCGCVCSPFDHGGGKCHWPQLDLRVATCELVAWNRGFCPHGPTVAMAPWPTRTAGSADIEDLVVFE